MALDFLSSALNVGTQAAGAHSRGRQAGLQSERQNMLEIQRLQRQNEQDLIADRLRQREYQTMDLRDKLLQGQVDEMPVAQRIRELKAQGMERDLSRPDLAEGTEPYYQHLEKVEGIRDRFRERADARGEARRESQRRGALDQSEKARTAYVAKRIAELTRPGKDPQTGLPVPGMSPQEANARAREEWGLATGEQQAQPDAGIDLREAEPPQVRLQKIQDAYRRAIELGIDEGEAASLRDEALAEISQSLGL